MRAPAPATGRGALAAAWAGFAASTISRVYLFFSLSLVLIAILPSLAGWHGTVVQSGSMEPHISPGDVVLTVALPEDEPVPVGGVIVFRTPAEAEPSGEARSRLHRIVGANDDGTFITAGDANPDVDSVPLERSEITGQARLLIPHVGLPGMWLSHADWTPLALWVLLTLAALAAATIRPRTDPEPGPGAAGHPGGEADEEPGVEPGDQVSQDLSDEILASSGNVQDKKHAGSFGRRSLLVLGGASLTGFALLPQDKAVAGFSARTANTGSSWSVATRSPLTLGRVTGYVLFAGTSITNQQALGQGGTINGSLGTSPGTSINGFNNFTISGSIDRDTAGARNARTDAETLYTEATSLPLTGALPPVLGGVLGPGVYTSSGTTFTVNGILTLDGRGDPDSIFILRADTFTSAMNSTVRLVDGASANRVFWVIRRTITMNSGSTNQGNYLSEGNAVMQRDSALEGRLISLHGSITVTRATTVLPR